MPKRVDHEARRQRIADAVCRLAAREGLEGASLRRVAAEAGVSMGQVQHYFTTKDDMLLFAFHTVSDRVERRLGAAAADGVPSTRALLRVLLLTMLSADPEGRAEAPLWVAFLARAVVEPRLAEPFRAGAGSLTGFAADRIRAAQEAGEASPSVDADLAASALFALADGLMLRTLLAPETIQDAIATLDYQLDQVFPGGG